jgi:exopolysaccharide biosynthesis polyprenyl glycosylphosphotransferase
MKVLELRSDLGRGRSFKRIGFLGRNKLKAALVAGDALAIATSYAIVTLVAGFGHGSQWWKPWAVVSSAVAIGLFCIRMQGLFLARVSSVRIVELTRITRASTLLALCVIVVDRVARYGYRIRYTLWASVIACAVLVVWRSAFRAWMRAKRTKGEHQRRVLLVGGDAEVSRLVELFNTHPELGMKVVGLAGNRDEAVRNGLGGLWLADVDAAAGLAVQLRASGVVVSPASMTASKLNHLIRQMQTNDKHVHLATGVSGIDAGRLRTLPMSYEPLLYVEAPVLSRMQVVVKRVFDLVVSTLILVVASPIMAVVAALIKLQDRGPVFFRQERVGRNGEIFKVLKFRTMRVDAEAQLAKLREANERHGPLFKMERDPRVTRLGRILRETSLDELPQLFNVVKGEMSLVGPRPALPSEVAEFAPDLRQREAVLPGITGLWQVEARDNPSFEAYRRLDLFYVENWSITMDLLIVLATIEHLGSRLLASFRRPNPPAPDGSHVRSDLAESAA